MRFLTALLLLLFAAPAMGQPPIGQQATTEEDGPAERMSDHSTRPATKDEMQNLFAHLERALDQPAALVPPAR